MRTTLDLADALCKQAKSVAKAEGSSLTALVEEGLRLALANHQQRPRYRPADRSYGRKGLVDGVAWGDWDRVRDLIYQGRGT